MQNEEERVGSSSSASCAAPHQRGGVRDEFGVGVPVRVLSVGDAFIVESECRCDESECTLLGGVLPAVVVSRMRSFFLCVEELEVVTLPFDESTRVESVRVRADERVVSCGYVEDDDVVGFVGVVVCACARAGAAMTAAAAMNFRNMLLPPSMRFIE
jgi:hypothetical protein